MDVSQAMDAKFLERLEGLLEGQNVAEVCREALVSRTYLDQIRRGDRRKLSYSIVRRLAGALGVRTAYLGEGLAVEDEEVSNIAQLHAWDQRMTKQRLRYFERILTAQEAKPLRTSDLSPDVVEDAEAAQEELERLNDQDAR